MPIQVLEDIEAFSNRIDSIPSKDTSRRWPPEPMYCVWDCGQVSWPEKLVIMTMPLF